MPKEENLTKFFRHNMQAKRAVFVVSSTVEKGIMGDFNYTLVLDLQPEPDFKAKI